MNNKKRIVNLEYFREMIQICHRIPNQQFDELPFEEEILAFLKELGHNKEAEQIKLATKRSLIQTHISHASGSGVDEGTGIIPRVPDVPTYESDDEEISWKSSEDDDDDQDDHDDEQTDSDNDVQTPSQVENTDDEDSDENSHDVQTTQVIKDTYVTLTLVNPEGQQQSSSVSSRFVSIMLKPSPDTDKLRDEAQAEKEDFLNKLNENIQNIIKEQVKIQVSKILPKIKKTVNEQLEAEVLTRSSNSSKTSHAIATDLSEIELKKILIEKMESNKSIHKFDEQNNLYKALFNAYECDKLILNTYEDIVTLTRRRDDEDKDEKPSAGSNRGSKRRREEKEPESTSAPLEKTSKRSGKSTEGSKSHHKTASESAPADEPMHTTQDLEEATPQEFKTGAPNDQHVEKASQHPHWESTRDVYSKRRIIVVTELQIIKWHNYKHLDWINVRRDHDKLYKFKEGDFKRLRIKDIKDMMLLLHCHPRHVEDLQLGVKSYQKKLNLTKPDTYRSDLKRKEAYPTYSNPRGFIYQNKDKQNRLMCIDELHKFNDSTLNDVRTALDDRLKGIQMQYLPKTIWRRTKPPTHNHAWNKTLSATYGRIQPWISNLAKKANSRTSFNELMDTPVDFLAFMMNQFKVDTLNSELLAGPTYKLMKGSCKSLVELELFLKEFYGFAINRESARDVYSKRRIIAVTELQIVKWHNYKHLDWITVRRDDDKLYKLKKRDFKRLRIQDIKDMLLLLVQGKLTNLTYLPQTIWRRSDKDIAAAMIQPIDKQLKTRRIMRSLEKFV
nr:hypothetical protein [Tanacetum cinerariifolium]